MKIKMLLFATIALLFFSCTKNANIENESTIIVGGEYSTLANISFNNFTSSFKIKDSIYHFNRQNAYLRSNQPSSNQNVFSIALFDSVDEIHRNIELEIYTPLMKPEDFFKKGIINIDTIIIGTNHSVYENFYNINARLKWDTASFSNHIFKGKGYFELFEEIKGLIDTSIYYPSQTIEFEFK